MGFLIDIVGNLGVGKTTLAAQLAERLPAMPYWESPTARPFQELFSADKPRWALANQLDFFMFRAEQERQGRGAAAIAIHDGGLDQDFNVFCRLMLEAKYLAGPEYDLCAHTYQLLRALLPPPELTVYLEAPVAVIQARRQQRGRPNDDNIIALELLSRFQVHLDNWLLAQKGDNLIRFAAGGAVFWDETAVDQLADEIRRRLGC